MQNSNSAKRFGVPTSFLAIVLSTLIGLFCTNAWSGLLQNEQRIAQDQVVIDLSSVAEVLERSPMQFPAQLTPAQNPKLTFTWYRDTSTPAAYKIRLAPQVCNDIAQQLAMTDTPGFTCLPQPDADGKYWGQLRKL